VTGKVSNGQHRKKTELIYSQNSGQDTSMSGDDKIYQDDDRPQKSSNAKPTKQTKSKSKGKKGKTPAQPVTLPQPRIQRIEQLKNWQEELKLNEATKQCIAIT